MSKPKKTPPIYSAKPGQSETVQVKTFDNSSEKKFPEPEDKKPKQENKHAKQFYENRKYAI